MTDRPVPTIFSDRRAMLVAERAARLQSGTKDPAKWLADTMVEDVLDRLSFMRFEPKTALIGGLGSAAIADALEAGGSKVTRDTAAHPPPADRLVGADYDLVVDLQRLATVNDLPGALIQYRAALAPGGIFMAPIVGAGSLPVLRHAMLVADGDRPAPRIHPQVDNRAATMLLERAGFARQVVDGHRLTVRYGTLDRLIADLREQGLTGVLRQSSPPFGKQALLRAREAFTSFADKDGKVSEHFELLTLTGWNS